jgi:hypothetical protein
MDKRVVGRHLERDRYDGDIPHPGIGARRMQVPTPALQHHVTTEAVENHMPEVIVIDETAPSAAAARTIAERGVQPHRQCPWQQPDNLMLNPTLSDLIGGIQSVTLGDEEAAVDGPRSRPRAQGATDLRRHHRIRIATGTVHADVAETIDALLRGDQVAPELRWRDEGGVHRTQARPKPSANPALGPTERFSGLVGAGLGWRVEPGWRPDAREGGYRGGDRGRPAPFRAGSGGGWRAPRGRTSSGQGAQGPRRGGSANPPDTRDTEPGGFDFGGSGGAYDPSLMADAPFMTGDIADRGPLERGSIPMPEPRARDARELDRQREWRDAARQAIRTLDADAGAVAPSLDEDDDDDELDDEVAAEADVADETSAFYDLATAPDGYATAADHPHGRVRDQPQRLSRPSGSCSCRSSSSATRGGGRRHDPAQRLPPEAADPARGGERQADLCPEVEHDPADASLPDVPLLGRGRPARSGAARD